MEKRLEKKPLFSVKLGAVVQFRLERGQRHQQEFERKALYRRLPMAEEARPINSQNETVIPATQKPFYGMMNYHEPGSLISCRSLG